MSDYLGNLAARSLGPAQAVRPRLASRFEPVPSAVPAFEAAREPEGLETAVEETVVAPAPTRAPRSVAAPRERIAPPEPVEEESPAPPRRRRARRAPVEEEVEPAPERGRPEPVRAAVVPAAPVAVVPLQRAVAGRGVQPFEASPPVPLSTGVERGNDAQAKELVVPVVRSVVRDVPDRTIAPDRSLLSTPVERGTGGEASRANRSENRQPSQQEPASTILQPKVTVIERTPPPAHREAPAPTIQVTIGRIEVRATPAAKAPARERPAAPSSTLSLEEYLRQRSKGGRG
jgi:hypothetical protein